MGLSGREEEAAKVGVPPQAQSELGGGLPFPSLPLPYLLLLLQLGKGGNLLLLGVGIPPWGTP